MGRYSIELVGESNYQDAVRRLRVGDPVELEHEPDNRFDPDAVKACDVAGRTIGYVPRDSWLQRVVAEDGTDVLARVRAIVGGEPGKPQRGVVLDVFTAKDAQAEREGAPAPPIAPPVATPSDQAGPAVPKYETAKGQIIENRGPVAKEPAKPKGFLAGLWAGLFEENAEARRYMAQVQADRHRRIVGGPINRGNGPIYIRQGPNSFQSCMGCVGVVVAIFVILLVIV